MIYKPSKKGLCASVVGTVVVAFCCFTPILVITVGIVGLGALTPYLDLIIFPALGVMIIITVLAYRKYQKGCNDCRVEETDTNQ